MSTRWNKETKKLSRDRSGISMPTMVLDLLTGDKVWATDRKEEGIVMEEIFARSYVVNCIMEVLRGAKLKGYS